MCTETTSSLCFGVCSHEEIKNAGHTLLFLDDLFIIILQLLIAVYIRT